MIVATYNVAPYIEDFFESLLSQADGLSRLELIIVNDGSIDRSGVIAQEWERRYPRTFCYVEQENRGVSVARNTGLQHATGEWVCFPDPDDFLSPDYLTHVRREITGPYSRTLVAIATRLVFYRETTNTVTDDHPLHARFGSHITRHDSADMGHILLPHTSNTFMRRTDIEKHSLRFDDRIRPSFEDAHFITRLLLREPDRTVSLLPDPRYYYRKRLAEDSLVDGVVSNLEWYAPHLKYAYLSLLEEALRLRGHVPVFVQNNVLFSLLAKLRYLIGPNYDSTVLDHAAQEDFIGALSQIMTYIDTETLKHARLPGFFPLHRMALIACFKEDPLPAPRIVLQAPDSCADEIVLRWVRGGDVPDDIVITVDDVPACNDRRTSQRYMLFQRVYGQVFLHHIALRPGQNVCVSCSEETVSIWYKGQDLGAQVAYETFMSI